MIIELSAAASPCLIRKVMLLRLALLWVLLAVHATAGGVATFYIGTYTDHSDSEGIYVGTLDTITGRLSTLKLAAPEKNPNFLAISPDHQFLFAALANSVESFKIQADVCHVNVDRTGHAVFAASYDGGKIGAFPVDDNGMIGEAAATIPFTGSGPNPNRQKKPFAHSVYTDPFNAFVYACDLGTDSIWTFKLGPGATLTATSPPAAKVPPGSGPRHLVFSADGKFAYVANEIGVSTSVFSRDSSTGALTLLDTESNVWPGDPTSGTTSAEIVLYPTGKWLYVSNRGRDTISVFAIDAHGGIKLIQSVPSPVKFPRSIALDPTGHWIIAAGQNDNRIAEIEVDPATGQLSLTDTALMVGSPVCVVFVPDDLLTILR
jgi:6-phosphogluconolactonase